MDTSKPFSRIAASGDQQRNGPSWTNGNEPSSPILPENDHSLISLFIGGADIASRVFVTHPCTVLRRQCQVHQFAKTLHLTPFTLVPVACNIISKEGVLTFWKGTIGTCVVWGLSNITEIVLSDLFGLPRKVVANGSSEKYWKHIVLKSCTLFTMTPFIVSGFTETVRSEAGLGVEDSKVFDVLTKGVDRMRFLIFGARDSSRKFSVLNLAIPTTIFGTVHYIFENALHRIFYLMGKRYINRKREEEKSKYQQFVPMMFANLTSSVLTDLILFPFETVLHRLYIQGTRTLIDNLDTGIGAVSLTVKYNGFFDCLKSIIEREGFFALYSGVGALVMQYMLHYALQQLARVCFDRGSEVLRKATAHHPITTPPLSTNTSYAGPFSGPISSTAPHTGPFSQPMSPVNRPKKVLTVASPPRDPTQFPTFGESAAHFNAGSNYSSSRPNVFGSPPRSHKSSTLPTLSLNTDNLDDDDFVPDVASIAPPPVPITEQQQQASKPVAPKKQEINMESLGRELTAAEREEIQRRSELLMARDMFGFGEGEEAETVPYDDIVTKEEFEEWGTKVGTFLAKRHKAAHYGDLINKLILSVSEKLDAAEIRKISNHLKALADSKKDDKPKTITAGGAKKKKATLKGAGTKGNDYDDYGGDSNIRKMEDGLISMGQLVANGEMESMCWEDDELALRIAASQGRHPWNEMTSLERRCFHDVTADKDILKIYLFIRNKILQHWHMEPNVEVTWENVIAHLAEPYNAKRDLVRRILLYLTRYGYINYGCFHRLTAVSRHRTRKLVVVIGGGMAGVAAAKQLDSFGMDVVLLEASSRLGGRVLTKRLVNSFADGLKPKTRLVFGADLGGEYVRGCHANPFTPLIKQLSCTPVQLSSRVPLYDETGKHIDSQRVDLIKAKFLNMSTALLYLVNVKNVTAVDGEPLDLKAAFDQILEHCEMSNLKREERYWENYHELVGKVNQTMLEISELNESGRLLEKKAADLEKMKVDGRLSEIEAELASRFLYVDMCRFNKLYDAAKERRATLTALLKDIKKNEPSDCFMNENDKRVLDWFLASLEGCVGACLDELPIEFYDPAVIDGHKEFNMGLKEGFGPFVARLATIDKVQTNSRVTGIQYTQDKVVVDVSRTIVKKGDGEEPGETVEDRITADAVVCTVPLGVLKRNAIQFDPPLPEAKKEAIEKMGFGVINKVVLVFEKPFWNTEQSFFGHLNSWGSSRGEYYLFTSIGTKPVLSAVMAGTAAQCEQPKEVIVNGAMTVLKNIFGTSSTPKEPKEAFVTKWQADKNFYGSHSFVQKGANYEMYDILAEPLAGTSTDPTLPATSRVFFAGEHTYRSDPATLQGAFLSGMRAAAEVADHLIGQPFLKNTKEDYVDLSDEEEENKSSREAPIASDLQATNGDDDDIQILP